MNFSRKLLTKETEESLHLCAFSVVLLGEHEYVDDSTESVEQYTARAIHSQSKLWELDPKQVYKSFCRILETMGVWR